MKMDLLVGFLILAAIFSVFDALRKVNNNILDQTEEIKKLREELAKGTKN
ncbi:hypothetical protein L1999_13285 [Neobacillus drentensis]|nr:hypothetical protein [Neobacillus drentensis]ULT59995.1 hypothetical protein L1999_13285 [Neobacillus drentensis]